LDFKMTGADGSAPPAQKSGFKSGRQFRQTPFYFSRQHFPFSVAQAVRIKTQPVVQPQQLFQWRSQIRPGRIGQRARQPIASVPLLSLPLPA
jgi:hypothetical protein